ncbi:MAG: glycosyltransferase family 2 protein [Candidatus Melainabacteria bacterium]
MTQNAVSNRQPLVSIIMPAYNAGAFLAQAVTSVLNQTYPHWELLIIDDASTDDTAAVAARFTDERIRYHRVAKIGFPAGVRNTALRRAQGDLIAFLDADDVYYPQTLATLLAPLLRESHWQASYGYPQHINTEGAPETTQSVYLAPCDATADAQPAGSRISWKNVVLGEFMCNLPALMMRRSLFESVGLFNETLGATEDYEYFVRIFLKADLAHIAAVPAYVYQYRVHPASLTKDPARYAVLLETSVRLVDWLYRDCQFPVDIQPYRSQAYTECYRYLARERLLLGHGGLARVISMQAWRHPGIRRADWLKYFLPIMVRSFLPTALDHWLVNRKAGRKAAASPASASSAALQPQGVLS